MDKEQLAIARLQDAARLSEHRYKKPLMVTYSGGKDSQVLVALAERAGINFEVVNSHTTADAPETVYFIREQFKAMEERGIKCSIVMPRYKDKPVSMWTLIPQKLMPPTRLVRYCCAVLKENTGKNRFIATGVRWVESSRRKNSRGIMELNSRNREKRITLTTDNDEKRRDFESCELKGQMTVNPIVDWEDTEVWDYIKITTQESEAVERAYYEAQSYEALMAILSRQLNAGANTMIADMLHYYAGLCQKAQMKLKMVQDKVLARYIDPEENPNLIVHFDFEREEVRPVENEKV